jgi:TPR repeat protein
MKSIYELTVCNLILAGSVLAQNGRPDPYQVFADEYATNVYRTTPSQASRVQGDILPDLTQRPSLLRPGSIPAGVRYSFSTDALMADAATFLTNRFCASPLEGSSGFGKMLVVHPGAWANLSHLGSLRKKSATTWGFVVWDGRTNRQLSGIVLRDAEELKLVEAFIREQVHNGGGATIRALNTREMSKWWTFIGFDIQEPTLIMETKDTKRLFVFGFLNGQVVVLDELNSLPDLHGLGGGETSFAPPEIVLSTNWLAAARAALPEKYFQGGDLNFQEITNLLCRESRLGNNEAKGLWGWALLIQSSSPEEAKAGLQLFRKSASDGYVAAMLGLGFLFEGGKYVTKDYKEAFHWFSMAADKGDAEAQLHVGGCYFRGLGVNQDYSMAAKYYRRSADGTNYVAMKNMGYLLMNGFGVDKNLDAAKYWLSRAAKEGGNRRAMYNLGALCSRKSSDPNSIAQAFQWYEQSAELGDPLACFALADYYYYGWAVERNLDSFRSWRFKAATLGSTEAQYQMGVAFRTGDGVLKDAENSLMWYRKAAAKNHPKAFYDLALHYLEDKTNQASMTLANKYMLQAAQSGHRAAQFQYALSCFRGDLGTPDFENGKQWLNKAAENGWAQAEFSLYQLFYNGVAPATNCPSYPKDRDEAIKWLRRAAEHEHLQSQAVLAVMLIQGVDVPQNKAEAEKLLRSAAEHGYGQAQNDLGFAILNGDVGATDLVEAAKWCRLAESQFTDSVLLRRAKVNLSNALARLTTDQQLEVDRRVKDFQSLPPADLDPMTKDWERNPAYEQEDGLSY